MKRSIGSCLVTALVFVFQIAAFGQDDSAFQLRCSLQKGDRVDKVKKFYKISSDPERWARPAPSGAAYQYHFPEYGVWVFFDSNLHISSFRFDHPFAGKIGGIAICDTKDQVLRIKGEPERKSEGLTDQEAHEKRRRVESEIINALTDPAPKQMVIKAFQEITQVDASPPVFCTAWIYNVGAPAFERYDFGSLSGNVQTILSGHGTTE